MRLLGLLLVLAYGLLAAPPRPGVPIRVGWAYDGLPEAMRLYELKPGDWPIWKMDVVTKPGDAPVSREIPGSLVRLQPGQKKRVALFYTNPGRETLHFFAAPHELHPAADTLGFKFKCLCTNHVYNVPPGHSWYRVVELRLAKDFKGDHLDIMHHLVSVDAERADDFAGGMETGKEAP